MFGVYACIYTNSTLLYGQRNIFVVVKCYCISTTGYGDIYWYSPLNKAAANAAVNKNSPANKEKERRSSRREEVPEPGPPARPPLLARCAPPGIAIRIAQDKNTSGT